MFSGLRLASVFLGVLALGLYSDALVVRNTASPVTLPFARRFNFTGASKILEIDQARAKALKARALAKPGHFSRSAITNDPVTNQAVDYVANVLPISQLFSSLVCSSYFLCSEVGVGTPPSDCVYPLLSSSAALTRHQKSPCSSIPEAQTLGSVLRNDSSPRPPPLNHRIWWYVDALLCKCYY